MGYQVGPACYPQPLAAAVAVASAQAGNIVQNGLMSYVVQPGPVTASSITYTFTPITGGAPFSYVSPYEAVPCQMLDWSDGLQLGWLVAGVWLAVSGLMFIKRALGGEGDKNGDA